MLQISLRCLPERACIGINGQVQSAGRHVTPEPVVWLCVHACCWHLFHAKYAVLLLGGLNISSVALASLILNAVM